MFRSSDDDDHLMIETVGVILSVLMCDIWINVLLQTSALVGPVYIVSWNARWNSETLNYSYVTNYKAVQIYRNATDKGIRHHVIFSFLG
jgi:hypothetical protein